jgi:hypothetical protein
MSEFRQMVSDALSEVLSGGQRIHVIPSAGRWVVRREGAQRASKAFQSKEDAVERAATWAQRIEGGEVLVHDRLGRIVLRKKS